MYVPIPWLPIPRLYSNYMQGGVQWRIRSLQTLPVIHPKSPKLTPFKGLPMSTQQTHTPTCRIRRLKTPIPTKAHKAELISNVGPADFQHSPLLPPRFDPEGKTTGMDTKHEGPHIQLSFMLYENGAQRNSTKRVRRYFFCLPDLHWGEPFLIPQYETLPDRPWPITVAAIPVYLTTHPEEFPLGLPASGASLRTSFAAPIWSSEIENAKCRYNALVVPSFWWEKGPY